MTEPRTKLQSRAIAYLRCSTSDQDESLPSQLEWAIRRAEELGVAFAPSLRALEGGLAEGIHEVGDLYFDSAVTGADMTRPGFLAFNERAVGDSAITHVLVWSRDRFARPEEAEKAMLLEKAILFSGKDVCVAQGRSLPARTRNQHSVADDFTLLYEYAAAYAFRIDLAQKVLRGQNKNARAGRSNGGRAPYGMRRAAIFRDSEAIEFLRDGERRTGPGISVVIVPGTSDDDLQKLSIAKEIHGINRRGLGLNKIARILNDRGVPSPDFGRKRRSKTTGVVRTVSGKWTVSNVRAIIEQPLYMGCYAWGKRAEGTLLRFDKDTANSSRELLPNERDPGKAKAKKKVKREREEWLIAPHAKPFDPIVDPDVWMANYEQLKRRGSVGGQRGVPRCRDENRYPLQVVCGTCGQTMSGTPKYGRFVYLCSTYSNSHGSECAHNWCDRDIVVGFALRGIQQVVGDGRNADHLRNMLHEAVIEQTKEKRPSSQELVRLEDHLRALEQARRQADRDRRMAKEEVERQDAEFAYAEYLGETKSAKASLAALKRRLGVVVPNDIEAEIEETLTLLGKIRTTAQEADPGALRDVFSALGASVTVQFTPGRIGKRLNIPVNAELRLGEKHVELGKNGRGERI